jgi:hypothetical protein
MGHWRYLCKSGVFNLSVSCQPGRFLPIDPSFDLHDLSLHSFPSHCLGLQPHRLSSPAALHDQIHHYHPSKSPHTFQPPRLQTPSNLYPGHPLPQGGCPRIFPIWVSRVIGLGGRVSFPEHLSRPSAVLVLGFPRIADGFLHGFGCSFVRMTDADGQLLLVQWFVNQSLLTFIAEDRPNASAIFISSQTGRI